MDNNEINLDALLNSDAFVRYESIETRCAMNNFFELIEKNISDEKTADIIQGAESDYAFYLFNDAFKQGFCFAVKSLKFMLKI